MIPTPKWSPRNYGMVIKHGTVDCVFVLCWNAAILSFLFILMKFQVKGNYIVFVGSLSRSSLSPVSFQSTFDLFSLRWLPIVFCPRARWFRKSRDGASFQAPRQSRARDHAVKCWQTWRPKFVYRKRCLDRLWFQNICRLNRRPYLLLLNFKEKCTRYARVSINEPDLFDRHNHWAGQSKMVYYHT